ncbi:unnamed protein product [Lactuca saligna]|uniref:non-specific serine/threonine protein kinase n=1 Tax=Lactuca saligna TaxID=75948 RepID=A0AA35VT54_LACSI|nr:unnamed protein product [Lactuca saligna]
MGACSSKHEDTQLPVIKRNNCTDMEQSTKKNDPNVARKRWSFLALYTRGPAYYFFSRKSSSPATNGKTNPTVRRFFRRAFQPLTRAQHMKAVLARRHGEGKEGNVRLNKSFGFSKHIRHKCEIGEEVGKGHFGHTHRAKFKKGKHKGQQVAVKIIPKSKMTTAIAIDDVRREVTILKALSGHDHLIKFYDAYEDHDNVYLVMEFCEGGVLLDRILSRGGKFPEDDAKSLLIQILTVVAFCHLQGVVHRDLKPENFIYASKDKDAELKVIDFGLSDFISPDERLDDIVGSAYYVAPEVLQRSYGREADVWSTGIIAYVLLCGNRPFWGRTESGIFRAVLRNEPGFNETCWSKLSFEAKDFVKSLLIKDPRKRLTAVQALCHPWIRNGHEIKPPFDISILRFVKRYICSSSLRKATLQALSKTVTFDDLVYLKEQFSLLEPNNSGYISVETFKMALTKYSTDAMKESSVHDFLESLGKLKYRRMDFEEFCAAALRVHQLEGHDRWDEQTKTAYEIFEKDGNRSIVVEELASELSLSPSIPVRDVVEDLIRQTDGKLTYLGFVKVLQGASSRNVAKGQ